ncbi:hypothetical protein G4V62_12915 [Bacillaceae bacterium SIJ1]|nr:spore cortex biosynthesis protein YabQ [Litoribacterium kuwaitense]NGP45807.1 hypothetical protein [Litoribacterium kuwaitense]
MSITVQMASLLVMVGAGIWLGGSLDTYRRVWRRAFKNVWLAGLNDFIFGRSRRCSSLSPSGMSITVRCDFTYSWRCCSVFPFIKHY